MLPHSLTSPLQCRHRRPWNCIAGKSGIQIEQDARIRWRIKRLNRHVPRNSLGASHDLENSHTADMPARRPESEPEIQPPASILTHFSVVLSTVAQSVPQLAV